VISTTKAHKMANLRTCTFNHQSFSALYHSQFVTPCELEELSLSGLESAVSYGGIQRDVRVEPYMVHGLEDKRIGKGTTGGVQLVSGVPETSLSSKRIGK
jgi:hypothetical protein